MKNTETLTRNLKEILDDIPRTYADVFTLYNSNEESDEELDENLGDKLAKMRGELNKLDKKEMRELASKMVLECPSEQLNAFGRAIEALRVPHDDSESFHSVIVAAYEVKQRIVALLAPSNKNPHNMLLQKEFDATLFNNFNELALKILNNNETSISIRLALSTPDKNRRELINNVLSVFPDSELSTKIEAAFSLRHELDALLGDKPEEFFLSREFDPGLCHEFNSLCLSILNGKEEAIGEQLSKIQSSQTLSTICKKLEILNADASNKNNPFRKISSAVIPKKEQQQHTQKQIKEIEKQESSVTNPNRIFSNTMQNNNPEKIATQQNTKKENKIVKEESCFSNCGLF